MKLVEGKVAVETGLGPGMGKEMALLRARHGARLAIGAFSSTTVEEAAEEIRASVVFQPAGKARRQGSACNGPPHW
jgi:NAD(P)-dependent dehydrogenase (short-subunit alcohol dehydrogenase family)